METGSELDQSELCLSRLEGGVGSGRLKGIPNLLPSPPSPQFAADANHITSPKGWAAPENGVFVSIWDGFSRNSKKMYNLALLFVALKRIMLF